MNNILRSEEKAIFALRTLYQQYGYMPFKMSKFEEYEFYIQNKDFLVSDRIISFNDTNGKLLALKPDVTLSIIKNGEDKPGEKQKVCYNENVYRVSDNTHQFKEIMQTGIECIGEIDLYDLYEMVMLASKSLSLISDNFVIEISHLGLISALLEDACQNNNFKQEALKYIAEKNSHDLINTFDRYEIADENRERILKLISVYGERKSVIAQIEPSLKGVADECLAELKALSDMLDALPFGDKILFDFSTVNDTNYYNGIVFRGFISGISQSVLTGGQYDNLLKKMKRTSGAVGFAIYLDLLDEMPTDRAEYDVDVVIIYDQNTDKCRLAEMVEKTVGENKTVSVQSDDNTNIRCKQIIDLRKEG
ncbi:MAG: ATP phosphoribosyltransferase regulatory subunit [Clostridia bacterium]|nr:ATP phosphoribosyltransferase regulatory subunit [Clostridia bacterium]